MATISTLFTGASGKTMPGFLKLSIAEDIPCFETVYQPKEPVPVLDEFAFLSKPLAPTMAESAFEAVKTWHNNPLAMASENTETMILTEPVARIALGILDILERYGHKREQAKHVWRGKLNFLPIVQSYAGAGTPIRMIVPAFPFKSPNKIDKVLGRLPDLGEELALAHLNGLCETVHEDYGPGAEVTIVSDGVVYNDLLGVSDEDVWDYGEALRAMAVTKQFRNIKFVRIGDLLGAHHSDILTKVEYLTHASCYRRELIAKFEDPGFDPHEQILNDRDTCLTYRGYLKFLFHDLKYSPVVEPTWSKAKYKKYVKGVATAMIVRGKIFARAVRSKYSNYVRLSIHPSVGETKLPIQLIPQPAGTSAMTPWHSSIAVGTDGSFRTVHKADVANTHDIVYHDGRPYCLREKSELYAWCSAEVTIEHIYPCGLIVRPSFSLSARPTLNSVYMTKLNCLAKLQSPIIVRGFASTLEQDSVPSKAFAHSNATSIICANSDTDLQSVVDHDALPPKDYNVVENTNAEVAEAKPVHHNEIVIYFTKEDALFHGTKWDIRCISDPGICSQSIGDELVSYMVPNPARNRFTSSRLFFQHLPPSYTADDLKKTSWCVGEGSIPTDSPPRTVTIARHWEHSKLYLSWDLPQPHLATEATGCSLTTAPVTSNQEDFERVMTRLLYDRRVCLRVTLEEGDLVVYDESAVLALGTTPSEDASKPASTNGVLSDPEA
ncbi:hypothetical protein MMC13_001029 [Lambiella insularis]|nr:hypothetical protein [Lambiella insularis]